VTASRASEARRRKAAASPPAPARDFGVGAFFVDEGAQRQVGQCGAGPEHDDENGHRAGPAQIGFETGGCFRHGSIKARQDRASCHSYTPDAVARPLGRNAQYH
jgi:hypothetical protein